MTAASALGQGLPAKPEGRFSEDPCQPHSSGSISAISFYSFCTKWILSIGRNGNSSNSRPAKWFHAHAYPTTLYFSDGNDLVEGGKKGRTDRLTHFIRFRAGRTGHSFDLPEKGAP